MEEKCTIPVLGESHYKELEEQRKKLNQQARMLEQQEAKGKQQMIDQAVEVTTTDSPVEETATPNEKKGTWYFLKVKKYQLSEKAIKHVVRKENGYHYFYIYMKLLTEALDGDGIIFVDLYDDQDINEAISEMIDEEVEICEEAIEILKKAKLIGIGEVEDSYVRYIEMLDFKKFVGPESSAEKTRRYRQRKKEEQYNDYVTEM